MSMGYQYSFDVETGQHHVERTVRISRLHASERDDLRSF